MFQCKYKNQSGVCGLSVDSWVCSSSIQVTCRQMARLTLQPKAVLTDRGWRPRSLKSLEKECVSDILGLSSATTTQARTRDRSRPRACKRDGSKNVIMQKTWGLPITLWGLSLWDWRVRCVLYTYINVNCEQCCTAGMREKCQKYTFCFLSSFLEKPVISPHWFYLI